ncbi:HC-toxin efflux carrier TOXA protein [Rutstroemia sp. NJR-2017a BBW]|nr:HC-toxin efflux carrier TOXA protein [Rutstroemia sp. NJR-2017a BBW]
MSTEPHQTLAIPRSEAPSTMASIAASEERSGDSEKGLSPASPPPEMERQIKGIKWFIICVGFYIADFLYGLDNTVAADIQSAVLGTYGEITKLSWLGTGFPLGSIATILTLGKMYSVFNVKWTHIASVTTFIVGSAVCGAAPNMNALIVGRVIAGMGGAGMYLGLLNLITINTTMRERPLYLGGVGIVWGVGTILGPVIGGAFADSGATWRWAFYINLVLFGVTAPALLMIPSFDPQPNLSFLEKLKNIDWTGALLNAGLYTSFVLVLTFGGADWAWGDGRTIATFVVCFVILVLFAAQQYFCIFTTPDNRLFPVDFLKSRTMILLFVATSAAGTALFVPIFYIPLFFQFAKGDDGLEAAVRLMQFIVLYIVVVMAQGIIMPRIGYYWPFFILFGVFALAGSAPMVIVTTSTNAGKIYGFSILIAIACGMITQASYSIAPARLIRDGLPHMIPAAIGFINVAQIGGVVIGLAISGTVFQSTAFRNVKHAFEGLGFSDAQIRSAIAGSQSTLFESVSDSVRAKAVEGIVQAIDKTYYLVVAGGALVIITSLFMRREKLFMEVAAGGA